MSLLVWIAAAHASPGACPATPDHITSACGGCRPLFGELGDAGYELKPDTQHEVERCVRSVLGKEGRPWIEGARACVGESAEIEPELSRWLVTWLDDTGRGASPTRGAEDRRWSQCAAQIRHMDARPALCVSREAVTLDGSRRRGRSKVAMKLGIDNRCVRPLTCAITVSARRDGPAGDGATGVEAIMLGPSVTTSVPVTLRFPHPVAADLASWSVSDLRCAYPDQPTERHAPRTESVTTASATPSPTAD